MSHESVSIARLWHIQHPQSRYCASNASCWLRAALHYPRQHYRVDIERSNTLYRTSCCGRRRASFAFIMLPRPSTRSAAFVSPPNSIPTPSRRTNAFGNHARPMALDPTASFDNNLGNFLLAASDISPPISASAEIAEVRDNLQIEQLSPTTTLIVFIIGIIPFLWATYEFWRRIAVGASFGTGKDSVVIPSPFEEEGSNLITIGEDNNPSSSRGRRTLDRGALTVAYILFAVAGGSVAIAIASVVMSPQATPL